MKIYKLSQNVNNNYDTYDSMVVCAESEEEAKRITPSTGVVWKDNKLVDECDEDYTPCHWVVYLKDVKVEYLGEAKEGMEKGIIVSSYNAG